MIAKTSSQNKSNAQNCWRYSPEQTVFNLLFQMSLTVRYHWTSPLREALAKSVEKREKLWKKFPVVSHDVDLRAKLWSEVADELMEQFGVLIDSKHYISTLYQT